MTPVEPSAWWLYVMVNSPWLIQNISFHSMKKLTELAHQRSLAAPDEVTRDRSLKSFDFYAEYNSFL